MDTKPDSNPEHAGTYVVKDGVRILVEEVTADHPDGNCARPADDEAPAADVAVPANGVATVTVAPVFTIARV